MKKLKKDSVIYKFSSEDKAVLEIDAGEEVSIETDDCFRSQLQSENDSLDELNWDYINPATGPIYINSAEAGDILKVEIKDIEVAEQSVIIVAPGEGVVGDRIEKSITKILPVEDNQVIFNDELKLPLRPMIGVIGTAPADEEISTGNPGRHGGNMDCKRMMAGNTIYLPVNVDGALLSLGDLHSVMGDGEVALAGAETSGEVKLKIDVIKGAKMPLPLLEEEEKIITIASAKNLGEAVKGATDKMVDFLVEHHGFELAEATMLLSLVGDARICQVVDPLKTARFELEKKYLK